MDLDYFPKVDLINRPRVLYFSAMPEQVMIDALHARGYEVVSIMTLPRRSTREHQEYMLARAQGMTEGTINASEEDRFRLRLEMDAHGLFKNNGVSVKVSLNGSDLKQLFNWAPSRHTLVENTTMSQYALEERNIEVPQEAELEKKRQSTLRKLGEENSSEVLRSVSKNGRGKVSSRNIQRGRKGR